MDQKANTQIPEETPGHVDSVLRTARVVLRTMRGGVLLLLAVLFGLLEIGWEGATGPWTIAGLIAAVLLTVGQFVLPDRIVNGQLQVAIQKNQLKLDAADSEATLVQFWFTRWIFGMAMLESAAVLNCIMLALEENVISLATVSVLLVLISVRFPNRLKLDGWVQNRRQQLASILK